MKTIVVYYSLEGNTALIARGLAETLGADILRLETEKPFPEQAPAKYFKGGMSTVFRFKPKLKSPIPDLSAYDFIVLGTPVWAGSYAAPIHTLVKKHGFSGKKLAFFLCCGGGDTEKCLTRLKNALPGNDFAGELVFVEPLRQESRAAALEKAVAWAQSLMGGGEVPAPQDAEQAEEVPSSDDTENAGEAAVSEDVEKAEEAVVAEDAERVEEVPSSDDTEKTEEAAVPEDAEKTEEIAASEDAEKAEKA
jgi:flavodoxin